MPRQLISLIFFLLPALDMFGAGCHEDKSASNDTGSESTVSETDTGSDPYDTGSDTDTTHDTGWQGVSLVSLNAPTRDSVRVVFSQDPGSDKAGTVEAYSLHRGEDTLAVLAVEYDDTTRTALLTTDKQMLGVNYALEVLENKEPIAGLGGVLTSADTARFWVADWTALGSGAELELSARRAVVGEHCVIYVEEGQPSANAAAAAAVFDDLIFDIETQAFTTPPDQDGNGLITILWLNGQGYFTGYFNPINAYSSIQTELWWGLHSNEMELLHIDTVAMQYGAQYFLHICAHEFQHLLYNKRHGNQSEYWAYHDEGLAEMAVHLVNGQNNLARDSFLNDANGLIGKGLSLVDWNYGLYENYVLAYVFWTYVAGQIGGLDVIGDIFDLDTGDPDRVSAFLQANLGAGLPTVHQRSLIAAWAQQDTGLYSFEGLLNFEGQHPPTVKSGTTSADLEPFAGAFFPLSVDEVDYPGTQGEHIAFVGIDAAGNVDTEAPFTVSGGALLAYNTSFDYENYTPEHSGPDLAATARRAKVRRNFCVPPAWTDPPPVTPDHGQLLEAWKLVRRLELQR